MSDSRETDDKAELAYEPETGTSTLLMGGGFVAFSGFMLMTAGYICPVCYVVTPALFGIGGYQKYKYSKVKRQLNTEPEVQEA